MIKIKFWAASFIFYLGIPFLSYSQTGIGGQIPIHIGANGPVVHIHPRNFPENAPWEKVSLDGTVVGASGNYLLVRSADGVQHYVYFTGATRGYGNLAFQSHVFIHGRAAQGSFYADDIRALGYPLQSALSTRPPLSRPQPAYSQPEPPAYEPTTPPPYPQPEPEVYVQQAPQAYPPPQPSLARARIFRGTLLQAGPQRILVGMADGERRNIFVTGRTLVNGPLDEGVYVTIHANQWNGRWFAKSVAVSENESGNPPGYFPASYPPPYADSYPPAGPRFPFFFNRPGFGRTGPWR